MLTLTQLYTVTAIVSVSGGVLPLTVTINGNATNTADGATFTDNFTVMQDGTYILTATATDKTGATDSLSHTLVCCKTPPTIALTTPLKTTTLDLSCLVLGPADKDTCESNPTLDQDTLRNVFGAASFAPAVSVTGSLVEPASVTLTICEVDMCDLDENGNSFGDGIFHNFNHPCANSTYGVPDFE